MGKKKSNERDRVVKVGGNMQVNLFTSGGSGNLPLIPSNAGWGTRINNIADGYGLFRFTYIKAQFVAASTATAVGVLMGVPDTLPTALSSVAEVERSAFNNTGQTTPSYLVCNRDYLLGSAPNKWFKTVVSSTVESWSEIQGYLVGASFSLATLDVYLQYEIEFTDWLPTTSTPKVDLALLRRQIILELANGCESKSAPPATARQALGSASLPAESTGSLNPEMEVYRRS